MENFRSLFFTALGTLVEMSLISFLPCFRCGVMTICRGTPTKLVSGAPLKYTVPVTGDFQLS